MARASAIGTPKGMLHRLACVELHPLMSSGLAPCGPLLPMPITSEVCHLRGRQAGTRQQHTADVGDADCFELEGWQVWQLSGGMPGRAGCALGCAPPCNPPHFFASSYAAWPRLSS